MDILDKKGLSNLFYNNFPKEETDKMMYNYDNDILDVICLISVLGDKFYYSLDKLHREDGPAIEKNDGEKRYFINDLLHREGGPAIEYANGSKHYYYQDKRHRLDGPAIDNINGVKVWFYYGEKIYCDNQEEFEKILKMKAFI